VVSNTLHPKRLGRVVQRKKLPFSLSKSLFSSRQVHRKFPMQAALHRVLDGALIGILIIVAMMSAVALHSQYLWTETFTDLEKTRDLSRRILESTSILESYLLKNSTLSESLVPTRAEDLVYVDLPSQYHNELSVKKRFKEKIFEKISSYPIKHGY
tara:strand:+ start:250 stop:717 length:468 start_codon:yes stop_codon:yes gene_type:complete